MLQPKKIGLAYESNSNNVDTPKETVSNAELIGTLIKYGDLGKNVRISGSSREERRKKFREVYYGN